MTRVYASGLSPVDGDTCGACSMSSWKRPFEAPQNKTVPMTVERTDAANTAIWKCSASNKERHCETDSSERSSSSQLPPRVLRRLGGCALANCRCSCEEDAERLAYGKAGDDPSHEPALPNEDARVARHTRIRKCEDREDSIARSRSGVSQQAVGGRLESVVDSVERVQRRSGGSTP